MTIVSFPALIIFGVYEFMHLPVEDSAQNFIPQDSYIIIFQMVALLCLSILKAVKTFTKIVITWPYLTHVYRVSATSLHTLQSQATIPHIRLLWLA